MALSIKQIVDTVIQMSTEEASQLLKKDTALYQKLIKYSGELSQMYADYEGSMKSYNDLAKQNASLKRKIRAATRTNSEDLIASYSAQLQQIRNSQQEMRQKENFLSTAQTTLTNIYKKIFQLQRIVNQIEGNFIQMVYTSTRGGMTTVKLRAEDFENSMYSLDIDRYGQLVLRYNTAEIERVIADIKATQKKNRIITSSIQPKLEALYNEIIYRQQVANEHGSPYLMWKLGGIWYKTKAISVGDLLEAYTNALVNGENDKILMAAIENFNGSYDEQIDRLVNGYVSQVTNRSGFFTEDIRVGNTNQYYGVKSAGASLMGLKLIVTLANAITNAPNVTDKQIQSLQRAFNRANGRHQVTEIVEEEIMAACDELMSQFNSG